MNKVNVGVIGTGFIGPAHIEALRRIGFVNVQALADINEQTARCKAEQLGIPEAYGDYKELINNENIDAVHICTPNFLHYSMVKDALNAGKHVVCEKPLAMTSAEADELLSIAQEKKLANAVGFNLRFYPMVQQVKAMIDSGQLGELFAVNGSYQQDWLFYQTDYNWRIEPGMSGESRAVADIGSHWFDMIGFVTGLKVQRVCADFATFHKTRKKLRKEIETYSGKILCNDDYEEVPIGTEDYASILINFDKGAHGSVMVNQAAAGRKNRIYFEICGSKKSVAWSGERPNELWIGNRDGANQIMMKDPSLVDACIREFISYPGGHNEGFPDTSKQLFRKFYEYILETNEGKQAMFPTFEDGRNELLICEKIVSSVKKNCWETL